MSCSSNKLKWKLKYFVSFQCLCHVSSLRTDFAKRCRDVEVKTGIDVQGIDSNLMLMSPPVLSL